MLIGVPKEIKVQEHRVGLTPASVKEFTRNGHQVMVQSGAGEGILADDRAYEQAGAKIISSAKEIFEKAEMIVKVKEPQSAECKMLREGQVLFTYLHLAADADQARGLMDSGCVAIAYETVTSARGGLPLLAPMSEVAGRMGVQVGAYCMQKPAGGAGVLIGGVPGVKPADVTILGGGMAGTNAAQIAIGMGAHVTLLEKSIDRIRELESRFGRRINLVYSTTDAVEHYVRNADLVIGAVLVPGAKAPRLITRELLKKMRKRSVIVDIAIDQGGCTETSKPTTHENPTYEVEGIIHYCVANMPGAVPCTSTQALNNAVLPFALALAEKGWKKALTDDPHLRNGLNVCAGEITHAEVARDLNLSYSDPVKKLAA